ncbi:SLOG domain-containing protein [Pararhodospirillum oryzae]|uniref:Uncharacterized protein n=1 Tax=Pararhodospirillum oryzae TaxID=478448 RepID=A0A512H5L8_9PROT|nr:hypothetical protein [Pararhodospirillum oryzae]GEO80733.1 hypothetical protein ROR02_08640 [Pararhodospirillum oryzae]
MNAIFLSASVPVPGRGDYAKTANPTLIQFAVSALVRVVLGRRLLVWGGHPAITPMVRAAAEDLNVTLGHWVRLYQSRFFDGLYPDDNAAFPDVVPVEAVPDDRDASLEVLRRRMIGDHAFSAAVVIGGMDGAEREAGLFAAMHPTALLLPVASTGGAALKLHQRLTPDDAETAFSVSYIELFANRLGIDPAGPRAPKDSSPAPSRPPSPFALG